MKIQFCMLNSEVDTRYNFTNTLLDPIEDKLFSLGKVLEHYKKLFKSSDYTLVIILSATRKNDKLVVKGPTTLSKRKEVEFSFFIPYKEIDSFPDQMSYVLDYIAEGIIFVFNKYKTDPSGVKEAIEEVKQLIAADPEKYQQWTK